MNRILRGLLLLLALFGAAGSTGQVVRLGTYNVENYLLSAAGSRPAKSEESKAHVAEVLRALGADVLALQEIGGAGALEDLRDRVSRLGLVYPHAARIEGADTNIHVALLSRFPIPTRRAHTNDTFLLTGRRFRVSRGFLEAEVAVQPGYSLRVFVVHLKSRRATPEADEAEMRREEARLLRGKIDQCLRDDPQAKVVVLGDLNDTKDSEAVRLVIGRGRDRLVDTRPAERNGDTGFTPNPAWPPRTVTWTHYFGVEDGYSRIDYILLHPNAARGWKPEGTFLLTAPDWGRASDHRPLLVSLESGVGKR